MRRLFIILALVGLVSAMSVPVVHGQEAGLGRAARVVITTDWAPDLSAATFSARGAAVRRGLVCPAGTVVFSDVGDGGPHFDFSVTHTFTCGDGSGTFDFRLWVRLLDGPTIFVWSATGGTGDYTELDGRGIGFGRTVGDLFRDRYLGRLRN